MTKTDNNLTNSSQILDGTVGCPRQNQEGKTDDQLWEEGVVRPLLAHFAPLTLAELIRYLGYSQSKALLDDASQDDKHDLIAKMMAHNEHVIRTRPRTRQHAGYELGAREFTLTYSPKWFDDTEARTKMAKAIDKLCKYYADDIIQLRAVGEVGSNGLSHVHCFYQLRGGLKITDKNFKRAWIHWNPKKKIGHGFEGGHHATVKEASDFKGYIDKDIASAWLEKTVDNTT